MMTQTKHAGGRPAKLYTCNTCGAIMGAAEVRRHKCVVNQLSAEPVVAKRAASQAERTIERDEDVVVPAYDDF